MRIYYVFVVILLHFYRRSYATLYQNNSNKFDDLDPVEAILLSQSDVCSQTDDFKKIQCFRELPLPQYEVFEGEDVLLKCRVAHQKGKLQWAFKGKMLGFDRDIPHYPRIRMPGNPDIGDHSLFIETAKVSDSGNYECQLSPSASQPPRRRMTDLIVLRAPMDPVIYRDKIQVHQSISVSIRKDESSFIVNLTCISSGGNPRPRFSWCINENRVDSSYTTVTMLNESASVLSLRSDEIVNNDIISCEVSNSATMKRAKLSDRIIVVKIRVFKRVLPGPLQFSNIPSKVNTITIQENGRLTLSCLAKDIGDPPIKLSWTSTLYNFPIRENMIIPKYDQNISQSTLIIPEINAKWHRKLLTCSGTQDGLPATKSISTTILVKHLPQEIDLAVISMTTNNSVVNPKTVYCVKNEMIRFVCSSSTFYVKNVKMIWYAKVTEESVWKNAFTSRENIIEMDDGRLRLLKSLLEIFPNMLIKNMWKKMETNHLLQLACVLKSPDLSGEIRKEVQIKAYVPSSSPSISINDDNNSSILTNGQQVKIKCVVSGGNPVPELYLVDDHDQEISAPTYRQRNMTVVEYKMEVKPQDNGKRFRCITLSKITIDFKSLSSDIITLAIAVPPQMLTMEKPETHAGNRAQQNISYRCFTDSSFPTATIEWWWHHTCIRQHNWISADLRSQCQSQMLENHQITTFDPLTQSTSSSITISLLPSHDLTFIECTVASNPKWTMVTGRLSKVDQLTVQYLPMCVKPMSKVYIVEEGHNLTVIINATANPAINGYTWFMNNQAITRKLQMELKVDQFSVSNSKYDMMGNYTLMLENQLGKSAISFFLNVTFAPKLLGPSTETIQINLSKEYKHKAVIMCSAQANPFMDQTRVEWTREAPLVMDHQTLVNILRKRNPFTTSPSVHCAKGVWSANNVSINCISLGAIEIVSSFQVMPMDYRYIGSYKCIFSSNTTPASAVKTTHLMIQTRPIPIVNHRKSVYAANFGGTTEIACYFLSFPTLVVFWTRFDNLRCSPDSKKYSVLTSSPQTWLLKTILRISDTNNLDIGRYSCNAQNLYGKSTYSVELMTPGVPVQPMNISIINVTDTSMTVGWLPGFNGGSKQTFLLRWRLRGNGRKDDYNSIELSEVKQSDLQFYTINNLQSGEEYDLSIHATNQYTVNADNPIQLFIKTMRFESGGKNVQEKTHTNNIFIIILLSAIGGLLIGFKIGLVIYFVWKRNFKYRKSLSIISSPMSHRVTNGYFCSNNGMEMRSESLLRNGIESNMYAQSMSDHMSQNGSEHDQKLNYYKTISDEFQSSYLNPDSDLIVSTIGRNNANPNRISSNVHKRSLPIPDLSNFSEPTDAHITDYFTYNPVYRNQTPSRSARPMIIHSTPQQYSTVLQYPKHFDGINCPSSAVSTNSGDSNHSLTYNKRYPTYSPLIGQSGAPSTVEEYLSSGNSGSEQLTFELNANEEYLYNPMTTFHLSKRRHRRDTSQYDMSTQQFMPAVSNQTRALTNGSDIPFSAIGNRMYQSTNSETEHLLTAQMNSSLFSNIQNSPKVFSNNDVIPHSSPSVIRINTTISEIV